MRDSDKSTDSKMLTGDVSSPMGAPLANVESVPALSSENGLKKGDERVKLTSTQRCSLRRKLSCLRKHAEFMNVERDKLVVEAIFSNEDRKRERFTPLQKRYLRSKYAAFRPADFVEKDDEPTHGCETVVKEKVTSTENASSEPVESVLNISTSSKSKEEESNGRLSRSQRKNKRRNELKKIKRLMALENNEGNSVDKASNGFESLIVSQVASGKELKLEAGKEVLNSVSQAVVTKALKESLVISENRSDSPGNVGAIVVETQGVNNKVNGDLSGGKEGDSSILGKDEMKKRKRKRRKSSDTCGGSLELIKEEGAKNEHKNGLLEHGSTVASEQVMEESTGQIPGSLIAACVKDKKRKRKSKVKEASGGNLLMKGVMEESADQIPGSLPAACKEDKKRKKKSKLKEASGGNLIMKEESTEQIPGSLIAECKKDKKRKKRSKVKETSEVNISVKDESQIESTIPLERVLISHPKKKLLVLDLNGILMDVAQGVKKPDLVLKRKSVYKRPFCDDFLAFCFERFNVGVWSSRLKENVTKLVDLIFRESKQKLLFCWHQRHCTKTKFNTIGGQSKPLVLKELKRLWEKSDPLPWAKGEYNESNTLLVDDSPYKALCNPAHTAIFPHPYDHRFDDFSLGPGGDIRVYLEAIAGAENVQKFVEENPFGQPIITEADPSWNFYRKVIGTKSKN